MALALNLGQNLRYCSYRNGSSSAISLRRGSPTFGEWEAFELDDENLHQLYCPIGFAHGFCVMSDQVDFEVGDGTAMAASTAPGPSTAP